MRELERITCQMNLRELLRKKWKETSSRVLAQAQVETSQAVKYAIKICVDFEGFLFYLYAILYHSGYR